MEYALIIISVVGVILLIRQLYLQRQLTLLSVQKERAISDRTEVADFINRYSASIGYSHDTEEWMHQIAGFVESAMEARAVWIYRFNQDGKADLVAFSGKCPHIDTNTPRQAKALLRALTAEHIDLSEESGLINQVLGPTPFHKENFEESYGPGPVKSLIAVPMMIGTDHVGAICVLNRFGPTPLYSSEDAFLLESISSQVALGLTFVQVYDELSRKQRIEQELKLAQSIQLSLLPSDPPAQEGYCIHADCRAAREVSGDFYDFIQVDDNLMLAVIADATGKGVPACMLAAMCRSIVRTNAERFKEDLEGLMKEVNRKLFEDTDYAQFITLACLLIDSNDNTVEYARAGHTALLIRSQDKHVEVISPKGPALGLLPPEVGPRFDTFTFSLLPGNSLMLFTDGITEALDHETQEDEFGVKRLIQAWNSDDGTSPFDAADRILNAVDAFTGGDDPSDDRTLMILHRPENMENAECLSKKHSEPMVSST